MTIIVVHPYKADLSTGLEQLLPQRHPADDSVILVSVMSEAKFRSIQSVYRSLRDVHIEYSITQAEEATHREAQHISSQLIELLGYQVKPLGRVGNLLRVAAAVAKAYEADEVCFTDNASPLRRWYRKHRLNQLGFTGEVLQSHPEVLQEPTPEIA